MATNNRPLKAYVRFDGSGRAVSSSLIWRKNKPKVGKWKEVQGYECCDTTGCDLPPIPLSTELWSGQSPSGCQPYIQFKCNNIFVFEFTPTTPTEIDTVEFLSYLQSQYSWIGTWSLAVDEITLNLEINGFLAKALCPDGELTMDFRFAGFDCP
jgi:hypothetical protein